MALPFLLAEEIRPTFFEINLELKRLTDLDFHQGQRCKVCKHWFFS